MRLLASHGRHSPLASSEKESWKDLASPCVAGVRMDAWLKFKRPGAVPVERFNYASR